MPQSIVHISTNEQREFYYNALIQKVAELKRFIDTAGESKTPDDVNTIKEVKRHLRDAISFKNMFDIKSATFSLTRDDVDVLTRLLNTSA